MEEKLILIYALFLMNKIHTVENTCDEDTAKSDNGHQICTYTCYIEYAIIEKQINCSDMSIRNIMSYIDTKEKKAEYPIMLDIIDSDIPVLPTSIFKNIPTLSTLSLENSNLHKIMPGAFNYLDNLKELYLHRNQLTTIADGIFNSLTFLELLDLSQNQIQYFSNHTFVGALNLNELYISHNNISEIGQTLIDSLSTAKTLDISWNNLRNINNFNKIVSLTNVDLSHNRINLVDFEYFPENLTKINLSFNEIREIINFNTTAASEIALGHNKITHFDKNENVKFLDLGYNELERIGNDLFGTNLQRLNAGNNLISNLDRRAFFGLYELEYLLLNSNSLSSLPNSCFKDLHSLIYLDLSRNKLASFTFGTFDNLLNLKVLNISYNNLKDFNQHTLYSLHNLTDLFFQNNEISEININDLKQHMSKLRTVNIDSNVWSCNKLANIIHNLKTIGVSFTDGTYWQESNIYGIKCYETEDKAVADDGSKSADDVSYKKLNSFFNEEFTKSIMYKYFNKDFKDSNFFKYLESLMNNTSIRNIQNINVTYFGTLMKELKLNYTDIYNKEFEQSAMFNYFNKDFKNSEFFKYFENFKNKATIDNISQKLIESKLEEVINSFKQIVGNNSNKSLNSSEDAWYPNIKEDLKHFFKQVESLNDNKVEKLISVPEIERTIPDNTGLLSFILTFLIIITCLLIVQAYLTTFPKNKFGNSKKEEVELI